MILTDELATLAYEWRQQFGEPLGTAIIGESELPTVRECLETGSMKPLEGALRRPGPPGDRLTSNVRDSTTFFARNQ